MKTLEQMKAVLAVLNGMKACIDANDTYVIHEGKPFNLHTSFGICWHVFAKTADREITQHFFHETFEEMGLDCSYPVEFSLNLKEGNFYSNFDKYNTSTDIGQARVKLLINLIKDLKNKIDSTEQSA